MACNLPNAPVYLHWNDRKILDETAYQDEQKLYRITETNNPIEFPGGNITSLSCKWSHIIEVEDIFLVNEPKLGNFYRTSTVLSIRNVNLKREKTNGENLGFHVLVCSFSHKPEDCDYSHTEINITHKIYSDELETKLKFEKTYSYELWQSGEALLKSSGKFYKELRKDYRTELIKIFI